jgi:hypothetical protein
MRALWSPGFPPVYVHAAWDSPIANVAVLPDNPLYWPAKKKRDSGAALELCDRIAQEGTLEALWDTCHTADDRPPLVVAARLLTLSERESMERATRELHQEFATRLERRPARFDFKRKKKRALVHAE